MVSCNTRSHGDAMNKKRDYYQDDGIKRKEISQSKGASDGGGERGRIAFTNLKGKDDVPLLCL